MFGDISAGDWLLLIVRWVHAIGAVAWVGGSIFFAAVLRPLAAANPEGMRGVMGPIGSAYREVVDIAVVSLIVSGVILMFNRLTGNDATAAWFIVLGVKLAIALWMFYLVWRLRQSGYRPTPGRGDGGSDHGLVLPAEEAGIVMPVRLEAAALARLHREPQLAEGDAGVDVEPARGDAGKLQARWWSVVERECHLEELASAGIALRAQDVRQPLDRHLGMRVRGERRLARAGEQLRERRIAAQVRAQGEQVDEGADERLHLARRAASSIGVSAGDEDSRQRVAEHSSEIDRLFAHQDEVRTQLGKTEGKLASEWAAIKTQWTELSRGTEISASDSISRHSALVR